MDSGSNIRLLVFPARWMESLTYRLRLPEPRMDSPTYRSFHIGGFAGRPSSFFGVLRQFLQPHLMSSGVIPIEGYNTDPPSNSGRIHVVLAKATLIQRAAIAHKCDRVIEPSGTTRKVGEFLCLCEDLYFGRLSRWFHAARSSKLQEAFPIGEIGRAIRNNL